MLKKNHIPYNRKKAIIDQVLLILFLFFALLALGATISDNMEARDKYYNLKKVTDNSALTLAKYYNTTLEYSTTEEEEKIKSEASDINYDMLKETTLGNQVKDVITYTWSLDTDPKTVTATISNYTHQTFWLKLIGMKTLDVNVESIVKLENINMSSGFAPFAINDRPEFDDLDTYGESLKDITLNYSLTADWLFNDKDTFYPIYVDCDCDCQFMLSKKFEFTNFGETVSTCAEGESSCTTHGESEFKDYTKDIINIYESELSIDFDNDEVDTPLCLLGTYLGNENSTWGTQVNHLSSGIQTLVDTHGPVFEMDLITLGTDALANGIVRVKVTDFTFNKKGKKDDYITFTVDVVKKIEKVQLTDRKVELVE